MSPSPVRLDIIDGIAVATIDSPPMNTLSTPVRQGLLEAVKNGLADDDAAALLIVCAGRTFIAGAEISEFGKPRQPPLPAEIVEWLEGAQKPTIAAIHGTALGGGFEFAMGCHYRVALASAKVGLPEVHLGILPGGGGTQRMPRLIGAAKALDLMLSGRHVPAPEALELGLIDAVDDGDDALAAGMAFARRVVAENRPPRPTGAMAVPGPTDEGLFEKTVAKLEVAARGLVSPFRIVECVRAATELPFPDGLARERELARECQATPQREALIHAFFAERKTRKLPELDGVAARSVGKVGIVGGGTMGAGIGVALLNAGLPVTMIERDPESARQARKRIAGIYGRAIAKGRMTAAERDSLLDTRLVTATDMAALGDTDLAIEAAFEEMAVKKEIFAALDATLKPGAVLATNTSRLDVNEIAATTARPEDVIGLHFFSPANVMRLLEIVDGDATAPDVLATGFALAKRLGKVGVRAGVCDGFIGNRILAQYRKAADYMVEDGASPFDVDAAVVDFGYPMGPYRMGDLAGLDIAWAARKRLEPSRDPKERYVAIPDRMCEREWFGEKTGRGYYVYDVEAPRGRPNRELAAIIEAERMARGITPRAFTADEIVRRYMAIMINEAANVLADGTARRPLDIDVTAMLGYGFPRWRGGPMKYADMTGLAPILDDIRRFADEDPFFWNPSPLLVDLVKAGKTFDSLNTA